MKHSSRCYIFAAGSYYGLVNRPSANDYVIAADGGYQWCLQEKITPQLLLGDFDSLSQIPKDIPVRTFPMQKDDTDTMLAIKTGLDLGYLEFHLYGCSGGRLDHTLANLQALVYLSKQNAKGFLYGKHETFTAIENGSILLSGQKQQLFSVFCFGPDATGVSIQGAEYPLSNATLTSSFPMGVSNQFLEGVVSIRVQNGCLLVGWERSF